MSVRPVASEPGAGQVRDLRGRSGHRRHLPGTQRSRSCRCACRADLLFPRGHRAREARLPVGEPEGLMPNLLSCG
jgi:hypothetical protein